MKFIFSNVFTKDRKGYNALCSELGVASQGKNLKEAEHNIREAVELYIFPANKFPKFFRVSTDLRSQVFTAVI